MENHSDQEPPSYYDDSSDDDGDSLDYDTDSTSSFESGSSSYQRILQIVHGRDYETTVLSGLTDQEKKAYSESSVGVTKGENNDTPSGTKRPWLSTYSTLKRKKRLRSIKDHTGRRVARRASSAEFESSPFLHGPSKSASTVEAFEDPETISALCQETKHFYELPRQDMASKKAALSSPGLSVPAPRLATRGEEESQADQNTGSLMGSAPNRKALNDIESNPCKRMVPSLKSPASMTTFREALAPCVNPKLVALSFPPFIVVHVNDACCRMTDLTANEILGKPLQKLFGKDCSKRLDESVTIMHDQLAPVVTKYKGETLQCFVKVTLVGPERDHGSEQEHNGEAVDNTEDAGEDDTDLFVTHYGVELEAVGNDETYHDNVHLVSPETGTPCGILG